MEAQREEARAGKAGLVGAQRNQHGSDPAALGPLPLQMGQDQSLPSPGGRAARRGPGLPESVLPHGAGLWEQRPMASVGQRAAPALPTPQRAAGSSTPKLIHVVGRKDSCLLQDAGAQSPCTSLSPASPHVVFHYPVMLSPLFSPFPCIFFPFSGNCNQWKINTAKVKVAVEMAWESPLTLGLDNQADASSRAPNKSPNYK